jgi:hypothetical protein
VVCSFVSCGLLELLWFVFAVPNQPMFRVRLLYVLWNAASIYALFPSQAPSQRKWQSCHCLRPLISTVFFREILSAFYPLRFNRRPAGIPSPSPAPPCWKCARTEGCFQYVAGDTRYLSRAFAFATTQLSRPLPGAIRAIRYTVRLVADRADGTRYGCHVFTRECPVAADCSVVDPHRQPTRSSRHATDSR